MIVVPLLVAVAMAAPPRAIPNCAGKPAVKPASVVLTCADGNFGVRKLKWTNWGKPTAHATGTAYANNCKPTCAAGKVQTYKAKLVAKGHQVCHNVPSYAKVTVSFPGKSPYPKATPADLTYPRPCH